MWILYPDKTFKGACYGSSNNLSYCTHTHTSTNEDMSKLYAFQLDLLRLKVDIQEKKLKYYLKYIITSQRTKLAYRSFVNFTSTILENVFLPS